MHMSLIDLKNLLEDEINNSTGKVAVSKAILTSSGLQPLVQDLDAFLQAQLLLSTSPVLGFVLTDAVIPGPITDNKLVLQGKAKLLKEDAEVTVLFSVSGTDQVDLLVVAMFSDTWTFSKTFPSLTFKPFNDMQFKQTTFLLTTSPTEYPWPAPHNTPILLKQQGLHFISFLIMANFLDSLKNVFDGAMIPDTIVIKGYLDPTKINAPVGGTAKFLELSVEFQMPLLKSIPLEWFNPTLELNSMGSLADTDFNFSISLQDLNHTMEFPFICPFDDLKDLRFALHYDETMLLELKKILSALKIDLDVPDGAKLSLHEINCIVDGKKKQFLLHAVSDHYNATAVIVGLLSLTPPLPAENVFYFALKLSNQFELNSPPLIGKFIKDFFICKNLMITYSNVEITLDQTNLRNTINGLIVAQDSSLHIPDDAVIPSRLSLSMNVSILGKPLDVSFFNADSDCYEETQENLLLSSLLFSESNPYLDVSLDGAVLWLPKPGDVGPVRINKIGLSFAEGKLWLVANISFQSLGLDITLQGLSIGFALGSGNGTPEYQIEGLSVSYGTGPVTVSGTLLGTLEPVNFSGGLVIKTADFSIYALGAYTEINGDPSLFVYAVLNYPIGGPVFFFIDGLAAGFGFNRSLALPDHVSGVAEYPFVQWATNNPPPQQPTGDIGTQVSEILKELSDKRIVEPALGKNWLAFGIRFSSFGFIHSFALITVQFPELIIHLLGHSTLEFPPKTPPFARAELELLATISPVEGVAKVQGLISNAFLFSDSCRINGGFAFMYWFDKEHRGDFLLSIGGFHPQFKQPHYPSIDRLTLNWDIAGGFSVKGSLYFAMDSSAVMGGLSIDAGWKCGSLRAGFLVDTDFLMVYAPFRYYVSASIKVYGEGKVKRLGKMGFSIRADLEVWGPGFSIKARVKNRWFKFTIQSIRDSTSTEEVLEWNDFVKNVLPANDEGPITIDVSEGLISKVEKVGGTEDFYIVNGEKFVASIKSVIPLKSRSNSSEPGTLSIDWPAVPGDPSLNTEFGVGPTFTPNEKFASELMVALYSQKACNAFDARPIFDSVPKALWEYREPQDNGIPKISSGTATITDVMTGFRLIPKKPVPPEQLPPMKMKLLLFSRSDAVTFDWKFPVIPPGTAYPCETTVWNTVAGPEATINRPLLLGAAQSLGFHITSIVDVEPLTSKAQSELLDIPSFRRPGETKPWEKCLNN